MIGEKQAANHACVFLFSHNYLVETGDLLQFAI